MTTLELTLLGILKEGPNHAYNIARIIEARGMPERSTVGFSSIYLVLDKLQAEGYLESSLERQPKLPPRRIYRLTYEGEQALLTEIRRVLSTPTTGGGPFETALGLGKYLRREQLREALTIYEAELGRLIQIKVKELTECNSSDHLQRAVYTRPLALWQAERKWVREMLSLI